MQKTSQHNHILHTGALTCNIGKKTIKMKMMKILDDFQSFKNKEQFGHTIVHSIFLVGPPIKIIIDKKTGLRIFTDG